MTETQFVPKPGPPRDLSTLVVMDYQNVHLCGHDRFAEPGQLAHETLIEPMQFARRVISRRNVRQAPGFPKARLEEVRVFRGLPDATHDPDGHTFNKRHKKNWEISSNNVVKVIHRPLKYQYQRDATGRRLEDVHGKHVVDTSKAPSEKGIDVLCALALYAGSLDPRFDLVVLCSIDSDLAPAVEMAQDTRKAKIETSCWGDLNYGNFGQIRVAKGQPRPFNTVLEYQDFIASIDRHDYR